MKLEGKPIATVKEVWADTTQILFTDGTWILVHKDLSCTSDKLEQ